MNGSCFEEQKSKEESALSDNEKTKVNTSPAVDVEVGTAEDVDAIMKKYDRESNVRIWEGTPKFAIRILLAVFAPFMVWMNMRLLPV